MAPSHPPVQLLGLWLYWVGAGDWCHHPNWSCLAGSCRQQLDWELQDGRWGWLGVIWQSTECLHAKFWHLMFSALFQAGFAGAEKDELTPAQWDHGAAVPALSCWKQPCQGLCSASVLLLELELGWLYCCSNLPPPCTWERLGKARKRETSHSLMLPGWAASPSLSPCVPLALADALAPSLRGWFSGLEVPSVLLNAG